ncbi:MAG: porin [Gammaproteobacteria bacterium]|nr:porin [Gammaproteobacteria bacterium]
MNYLPRWSLALLQLLALVLGFTTSIAHATNGMFMIGYGPKSRAMGGTSIANPQSVMAGATNPAAFNALKDTMVVGADLFKPVANVRLGSVEVNSGAKLIGSRKDNLFIMPGMGGVMKLSRKIKAGMTMVGAGGGGSLYEPNPYNAASNDPANRTDIPVEVELFILQMNPTISYKINKQHAVGASLVIGIQRFRAAGLALFKTFTITQLTDPDAAADRLTGRGIDWAGGLGVRVGWLGNFLNKRLTLGASATTQTYMSRFKKYSELFAEHGRFNTPANIGVGMSYKFNKKFLVAFDVTHTFYEGVAAVSNQGPETTGAPLGDNPTPRRLGQDDGLGFGWEDQTVYKLGLAYKLNKKWELRGGWNYGKSPIDETRNIIFNITAPATTQNHLTLGVGYKLSRGMEINASYVHAYRFSQNGPTYISDNGDNTGEIEMYQDSITIGMNMRM